MKGFLIAILLAALTIGTTVAYYTIKNDWVLYRQAENLIHKGMIAQALPIYKTLSAKGFRADGHMRLRLAELYEKQGDYASAAAIYGNLLTAEPGNRAIRIRMARALTALGRYDEAVAEYKTILGEKP